MLLLMAFEHEPEPSQAGLFWPPKALIMTSILSASAKQATLLQLTHVDQMFCLTKSFILIWAINFNCKQSELSLSFSLSLQSVCPPASLPLLLSLSLLLYSLSPFHHHTYHAALLLLKLFC